MLEAAILAAFELCIMSHVTYIGHVHAVKSIEVLTGLQSP